jgi:hypothetical protein
MLEDRDDRNRWVPAVSERKKGRGKERAGRAGWAAGGGEQVTGLGRAWKEKKRKKANWAGPCGKRRREGKGERESGPGPRENEGEKIAFKCI